MCIRVHLDPHKKSWQNVAGLPPCYHSLAMWQMNMIFIVGVLKGPNTYSGIGKNGAGPIKVNAVPPMI